MWFLLVLESHSHPPFVHLGFRYRLVQIRCDCLLITFQETFISFTLWRLSSPTFPGDFYLHYLETLTSTTWRLSPPLFPGDFHLQYSLETDTSNSLEIFLSNIYLFSSCYIYILYLHLISINSFIWNNHFTSRDL